jgi:hypothetical protein
MGRARPPSHCRSANARRHCQIRKGVPLFDFTAVTTELKIRTLTWPQKYASAADHFDRKRSARRRGGSCGWSITITCGRAAHGERIPFIHQSNPSNDWWVFHHGELAKEIGFGPLANGDHERSAAAAGEP